VSPHIRKVKTGSGPTAVQIVEKRSGVRRILEHLGSAHDEAGAAVLVPAGHERLNAGQQAFALDLAPAGTECTPPAHNAVVAGSRCEVLWEVLAEAYSGLGFDVLGDEAFAAMVLARLVEPASKAATVGILGSVWPPRTGTLSARH
jgi:hypothetical protein